MTCLVCGKEVPGKEEYHLSCCRKFFNLDKVPVLDYNLKELNKIAKESVLKSISVTGVQPKLSLHLSKVKGEKGKKFTIVGLWGGYILKPPSQDYPFLPENEHLTMLLAEVFGIKTVPHALIKFKSGELAYISKRIDRVRSGKLHMEDMCQLQERLTEDKYRGSVEQIGKTLVKYSSNPGYDLQRLFEVVLFSFLTGNADMHLKNYSLFYRTPDFLEFSPAYDLLNTAIALPSDKEESALSINGKKAKLKKDDFHNLAENFEIDKKVVSGIVEKFNKNMKEVPNLVENSFLNDDFKEKYMEILNSRFSRIF